MTVGGPALGAVAVLTFAGLGLAGCANEPEFAVDDCVRIDDQILESEMKSVGCAEAEGTFDPADRIYRVESIIEGTEGTCPEMQGFFPVQFTHEPDGVIYCLVQQE